MKVNCPKCGSPESTPHNMAHGLEICDRCESHFVGYPAPKQYPDCNGLYPHSITKEGCVYCNKLEETENLMNPPLKCKEIETTNHNFDTQAGGVNVVITGLREEQEYQPGPWYCELIYKFYHWCQDWLDDLETWAIAKENKARKKQHEHSRLINK